MDRAEELSLIEELLNLSDNKSFYLEADVSQWSTDRYLSREAFADEVTNIFRKAPIIAAHSSELSDPNSYITRDFMGLPLLLTRDKAGGVHAFLNVCRHRGSRLESDAKGCKRAFSCPYHAWTWTNTGDLKGVPHQKQGFPGLDRADYGLKRLPVSEICGLIWVIADPQADPRTIDPFVTPLLPSLAWCQMDNMQIVASDTFMINANWKLLVEGGIEAYHFKVTHRDTIGPHFFDNLSSYQKIGTHMRSVLPKSSLSELVDLPKEDWQIRAHTNVLYSVFPCNQFLLMEDHIAWVELRPVSPNQSEVRINTLAHIDDVTVENRSHWSHNHQITITTLKEDFDVNEGAQTGLESGANDTFIFGRYEGALDRFNTTVDSWRDNAL